MRSIFSSGMLDAFIDNDFNPFDFYIGVSAGAFNLSTFLAKQNGLSRQVYIDAATSEEFISLARYLRGGHLMDLDWLSDNLLKKYKFEPALTAIHGKPYYVCTTSVQDGKPCYIQITPQNFLQAIKATTALPLIFRYFPIIDNKSMTDGGVADGIPVKKTIALGANRIMLIRSRHFTYRKRDTLWHKYIRWKLRHYSELLRTMQERVLQFDTSIALTRNPPDGIKILEICPPELFNSGRLSRNVRKLNYGYETGYKMAADAILQWQKIIEDNNR